MNAGARRYAPSVIVVCLAGLAACSGAPQTPTAPSQSATQSTPTGGGADTPTAPAPAPPPRPSVASLAVVGDVGWCGSSAVAQTASLVDRLPGDLLLVGDLAYPNGTSEDFRRCFDPEYGRFRSRFRPLPGNHEYDRAGADGYFTYFGEAAGPGRNGYYAFRAGAWQVLLLNSSVPIGRGSAQYEWARQALEGEPALCTLAAVHHPYDSSGQHGGTPWLEDIWRLLYEKNADVVVNGHEHLYERLGPMGPDRRGDPLRGLRQFTVGTGGAPLYPPGRHTPNSEVAMATHGVLSLRLEPGTYEWAFHEAAGGAITDRGVATCH